MDNEGESEPCKNADDGGTKTKEPVVLFATEVDVNVSARGGCASPSAPLLEDDRDAMEPSAPALEPLPQPEMTYVHMPEELPPLSASPRSSMLSDVPMATRTHKTDDVLLGGWEVGLFSCFKHCVPNGWMMLCCPCISLAQVTHRLGIASYGVALGFFGIMFMLQCTFTTITAKLSSMQDDSDDVGNSGSGLGSASSDVADGNSVFERFSEAVAILAWVMYLAAQWYVRAELRRRLDIPGWCLGDCFAVWLSALGCCPDCATAQMATQLKTYRPGHWDFGPSDVLPPFEWEQLRTAK